MTPAPNLFQFCLGRRITALPESVLETTGPVVLGCVTRLLSLWAEGLKGANRLLCLERLLRRLLWKLGLKNKVASPARSTSLWETSPESFPFPLRVFSGNSLPLNKPTNKTNMGVGGEVAWNCLWRLKLKRIAEYFVGAGRGGPYPCPVYIKGILCLFFFFKHCDGLRADAGFFFCMLQFSGFYFGFLFFFLLRKKNGSPILNIAHVGNREEVGWKGEPRAWNQRSLFYLKRCRGLSCACWTISSF